jgi:hypothetical protein
MIVHEGHTAWHPARAAAGGSPILYQVAQVSTPLVTPSIQLNSHSYIIVDGFEPRLHRMAELIGFSITVRQLRLTGSDALLADGASYCLIQHTT